MLAHDFNHSTWEVAEAGSFLAGGHPGPRTAGITKRNLVSGCVCVGVCVGMPPEKNLRQLG